MSAPLGHQIVQRVFQPEIVERQRTQPRNDAVHHVVQVIRRVDDELRRFGAARIGLSVAPHDRQSHALDGGHGLPHFVVQFARDVAPFLFDAALDELRQFAVFLQIAARFHRFLPCTQVVLNRLRHAVEGLRHRSGFTAGQGFEAGVIVAGAHLLQATHDAVERPRRASDQPEHQRVAQHQRDRAGDQQVKRFVPAVEDGARCVGLDHQFRTVGQRDFLTWPVRQNGVRVPDRRFATRLVGRGRRCIQFGTAAIDQPDVGGAHPPEPVQEIDQRR